MILLDDALAKKMDSENHNRVNLSSFGCYYGLKIDNH